MPYLNLGKTNINYNKTEDEFIITMILDTSSSYEYPVLVRDMSTLDIYFGKSSGYRDFLNEMISYGATLYLYRPIQLMSPSESWIEEIDRLKDEGVDDEFIPSNRENLYSNFIIPENSPSWTNRDTIRIFNSKVHNGYSFNYCYPEYNKDYNFYRSDGSSYNLGLGGSESSIDNYKLDNNHETLAFNLDFTNVSEDDFKPDKDNGECRYIVIPYLGDNYMIWFKYNESDSAPDIIGIKSGMYVDINGISKDEIITKVTNILTSDYSLSEPYGLNYEVVKSDHNGYNIVISKRRTEGLLNVDEINVNIQTPEKNYHYYSLPNFFMDSDFRRTNDILSEATEEIKQIEFYSKTIGKCDEDIKITIEKLSGSQYEYKIVISRFDYSEYYEVNIGKSYMSSSSYQPLTSVINKNSKLVYCKLFDRVNDLPEGTFYLKGSYKETYTYEERRQSLDIIKDLEINDDVLIIDDLELWKSDSNISSEDLKIFLEYSSYKDNQTFITNRSYRNLDPVTGGYNTYHEYRYNITDEDRWIRNLLTVRNDLLCNIDVILNVGDITEVISDKQNRLVYFYNSMTLFDSYRPGCYVFLKGILNNNYSMESKDIVYNLPTDSVLQELPTYKCNYMSYNNSYYYYPRYQNGLTSKITMVTRFMVSKIGREFKRNKWKLVSLPIYERNKSIDKIISKVLYRFSIIKSISIEEVSQDKNSLTVRIKSEINELAVKDIDINITLNYN